VRYSGDMAYFVSAQGAKRPLKLEFNKFQDQSLAGLSLKSLIPVRTNFPIGC
jgi:hypothetical protein